MLRSTNELIGYRLYAKNDDVGKCDDLLFDDQWWTIRHMEANTGGWLIGHHVLVSPIMIEKADWESRMIVLNISKETLAECPSPSTDEPVSREHEKRIHEYYGFPHYWTGSDLWGPGLYPTEVLSQETKIIEETLPGDNRLRSFKEVKGYAIQAVDGKIGHVQDFILDDETWALRYLIVDTRNWLPGGKKVMLSLNWAESVSWEESKFSVNLMKDQIKNSPAFDPLKPVNAEVETRLYDYYGRPFENTISKQLQQNIANPFV